MKSILCITLNPAIQKTVNFKSLSLGEVNRAVSYRTDAAGKAINSARVLEQLEKGTSKVLCPIGKFNADTFISLTKDSNLSCSFVKIPGKTRECWTLLNHESGETTEIICTEPDFFATPESCTRCEAETAETEENFPTSKADIASVKAEIEEKFLSALKTELKTASAVIFAGSVPSFWSDDFFKKMISLICGGNGLGWENTSKDGDTSVREEKKGCAELFENEKTSGRVEDSVSSSQKIPFLADFCGKRLLSAMKVSTPEIIKINEEEFWETFGRQSEKAPEAPEKNQSITESSSDSAEEKLKLSIAEKSRELSNIIVVTRGNKSTFAAEKGKFFETPIEKVKAVNTTACGDSFSAGFIYEYLKSGNLEAALKKGTWCAARNAESTAPGSIFSEGA